VKPCELGHDPVLAPGHGNRPRFVLIQERDSGVKRWACICKRCGTLYMLKSELAKIDELYR
jgi:hypothetical protein